MTRGGLRSNPVYSVSNYEKRTVRMQGKQKGFFQERKINVGGGGRYERTAFLISERVEETSPATEILRIERRASESENKCDVSEAVRRGREERRKNSLS